MTKPKHARFGPSRLEKMELCPHFESIEYKDNSAADEGTLLHEAVENEDLGMLDSEEQIELASSCITVVESLIKQMGPNATVHRELRVTLTEITYGTLDLLVIYVAAAFEGFPQLQTIEAGIVCPRQNWTSTWVYKRDDINRITLRAIATLARAGDPNIAPTPHADACHRCGKKSTCPSLHAIVAKAGEALEAPVIMDPVQMTDPADMAKAMIFSYIAEDWGKQVRKRLLTAAVEEGVDIPFFKVRTRKGNMSVRDPHIVLKRVLEHYDGLDLDILLNCCSVRFAEMVTAIASATGGNDKQQIREELSVIIGDHLEQHSQITYLQKEGRKTHEEIRNALDLGHLVPGD